MDKFAEWLNSFAQITFPLFLLAPQLATALGIAIPLSEFILLSFFVIIDYLLLAYFGIIMLSSFLSTNSIFYLFMYGWIIFTGLLGLFLIFRWVLVQQVTLNTVGNVRNLSASLPISTSPANEAAPREVKAVRKPKASRSKQAKKK